MPDFYSIQDVLSFAIRLEQASQEFYRHLSKKECDPSISAFFRMLATEEQKHEAQIQKLLDQQGGVLDKSISAEEVSRYMKAMHVSESLDYKEAVKLAKDKEEAARMLYSVLAGVMDHPALKDMFNCLAAQEKAHKEFFEKEYQRICVSEN